MQVADLKAREPVSRAKSVRGYFLVVGIGAFNGLAASLQSLVAKARKARGKGNPLHRKWKVANPWYTWHLANNHRPHVPSLVLRCPRSVRLRLAQLVVDHITLLVLVLISACCVDKLDIVHQNVPKRNNDCIFTWQTGIWYLWSGLCGVRCPVLWCYCRRNRTRSRREDIEDFVAFGIKSLEGFAILGGGATKTDSGFMSAQPVADQHEDTTIETTDFGFTFAGGETEAVSTKICIPHAEFPQGNSVNVERMNTFTYQLGCVT